MPKRLSEGERLKFRSHKSQAAWDEWRKKWRAKLKTKPGHKFKWPITVEELEYLRIICRYYKALPTKRKELKRALPFANKILKLLEG